MCTAPSVRVMDHACYITLNSLTSTPSHAHRLLLALSRTPTCTTHASRNAACTYAQMSTLTSSECRPCKPKPFAALSGCSRFRLWRAPRPRRWGVEDCSRAGGATALLGESTPLEAGAAAVLCDVFRGSVDGHPIKQAQQPEAVFTLMEMRRGPRRGSMPCSTNTRGRALQVLQRRNACSATWPRLCAGFAPCLRQHARSFD